MKLLAQIILLIGKVYGRLLMYIFKSSFHSIGKKVIFHPRNSDFTYHNISIGNNVSIGPHASFIAAISHIYIYIITRWRN